MDLDECKTCSVSYLYCKGHTKHVPFCASRHRNGCEHTLWLVLQMLKIYGFVSYINNCVQYIIWRTGSPPFLSWKVEFHCGIETHVEQNSPTWRNKIGSHDNLYI
jgi:hypothetical protein